MNDICRADGIIFDCDGVLVDVAQSYTETIIRTVSYVMQWLGMPGAPSITPAIIQSFKDTGSYNNEIDLAYAAILCLSGSDRTGLNPSEVLDTGSRYHGISDMEEYASTLGISDVLERLSYPGKDSIVSEVFDQLFYGPRLYHERFGIPSRFSEPGLIENEILVIDTPLSQWLRTKFGERIGLLTGRSRRSAEYTLGKYMNLFNVDASMFLEDMPRHLAKPNPQTLSDVIRAMNLRHCTYVGDSAEDLIMVKAMPDMVTFVGVYGSAPIPEDRRRAFESAGVVHMVGSITQLPTLLGQ